ncbi:MAG: hypothetical protein V1712_02515 [Patescibacteria group bacterium]
MINLLNKKLNVFSKIFIILVLVLGVSTVAYQASATLTLDATSVTSSAALTLNGAAASAIVIGNTAQTAAISLGDTASSTLAELSLGGGDGVKTINIGDGTGANTITIGGGDASIIVVNGRIASEAIAGTNIGLDSSYTYGEGVELKYDVDDWTGIAGSFKGYYFRTEANVGHATYGLRGMEVYSVLDIDSGTTGIGSLTGLYSELLVKAPATSYTIDGYPNAFEGTFDYEAATAGTTTITNGVAAGVFKIQTATGLASYTNLDGVRIIGRDADAVRVMGDGLAIENDAVGSHATWTNAIAISAGAAYGLNITGTMSTADIKLGNGALIANGDANTLTITEANLVLTAARTITASEENHGLDVNFTGTMGSSSGAVAGNFIMTTAGTSGAWASGIYAKVTQDTTKHVTGYLSGAEFEVVNTNTNVSDWFPLVLNANSTTLGSHSSYIAMRNYGTAALNSLLWIEDQTVDTGNSATALVTNYDDAPEGHLTHAIRIIIDDTPYWIPITAVAPH